MKTTKTNKAVRRKEGGIAIALMLIAFTLAVTIGSYLQFSVNNARVTHRALIHERARVLAESALESAEAQLGIAVEAAELGLISTPLQRYVDDRTKVKIPDFAGSDTDYAVKVYELEMLNGGFIATNINGKLTESQEIMLTAGVEHTASGIAAAFQKRVRITREPFLRYAIFFDDYLELHPGPAMLVNGDIRANTKIEFYAGDSLKIDGQVKCSGDIVIHKSDVADTASENSESGKTSASKKISVKVAGTGNDYETFYQDNSYLDSTKDNWNQLSLDTWQGGVINGDSVAKLNPPIGDETDNHLLIDPPDHKDNGRLLKEKMAYKADLYVTVDPNGHVSVSNRYGGDQTNYPSASYAVPTGAKSGGMYELEAGDGRWLNVHTDYYDPRESEKAYRDGPQAGSGAQQMQMVDIYMDQLIKTYPDTKIVYVEVDDPQGNSLKPAVRLRNGADLTAGNQEGISIATHRTLFVEGDYNSNQTIPALIAGDNVTLLSNAWDDQNSQYMMPGSNKQGWKATETSLNAAVMAGYNDPENLAGNPGTTFTGGAHNLIRYRENWSGVDYNFKGSYLSLWFAQDSHCLISGQTYSPPRRNISYDTTFKTRQPPGMPMGYTDPEVVYWKEISMNDALAVAAEKNNP